MTAYRIVHQETADPERWRLSEDVVEAHSAKAAVSAWVKAHETEAQVVEGSLVYVAVPTRSWKERTARQEPQMRLVVS